MKLEDIDPPIDVTAVASFVNRVIALAESHDKGKDIPEPLDESLDSPYRWELVDDSEDSKIAVFMSNSGVKYAVAFLKTNPDFQKFYERGLCALSFYPEDDPHSSFRIRLTGQEKEAPTKIYATVIDVIRSEIDGNWAKGVFFAAVDKRVSVNARIAKVFEKEGWTHSKEGSYDIVQK